MMNENISTKEVERKAHYLYRSFKHVAELSAIAEKVWSHPVHHAPVLQQVVLRGIMVRMEVVMLVRMVVVTMVLVMVVVELSRARCGREEQKAMLQVSRWLNLVQAWSGQLTVAPLQTYYRS